MRKNYRAMLTGVALLLAAKSFALAADTIWTAEVGSTSATSTQFAAYHDSVSSACRGTYNVEFTVRRGSVTQTSVYFEWHRIRVYNLSGTSTGGMAYLDNTNGTTHGHNGLFNQPLAANVTYEIAWNRALTLGPNNVAVVKQNHYSGPAEGTLGCGHHEQVIYQVTQASSSVAAASIMTSQLESRDTNVASLDEAEKLSGMKLLRPTHLPEGASTPIISVARDAGRQQTVYFINDQLLDITQSDRRIEMVAAREIHSADGMRVLQGNNESGQSITIIESQINNHWLYVITTLPLEEAKAVAQAMVQ